MSDEDLSTYNLQLQQVEAALTTDPTNEELLQLKTDLEQVITLTKELISAQSTSQPQEDEDDSVTPEPEKKQRSKFTEDMIPDTKCWEVGDVCEAIYPGDTHGLYREAVIEEISRDGDVTIRFKAYQGTTYVTVLEALQPVSSNQPVQEKEQQSSSKSKKEMLIKQKEYQKEKKRKKLEKLKEMEASREKEKHKWQSFSNKAFGKKGFVKKSIFKTPETAGGKVGVGTCGISGQGMTDYKQAKKYRKNF